MDAVGPARAGPGRASRTCSVYQAVRCALKRIRSGAPGPMDRALARRSERASASDVEARLPEHDRRVDLRGPRDEHRQPLAAHEVDPVDVVRVVPPVERRRRRTGSGRRSRLRGRRRRSARTGRHRAAGPWSASSAAPTSSRPKPLSESGPGLQSAQPLAGVASSALSFRSALTWSGRSAGLLAEQQRGGGRRPAARRTTCRRRACSPCCRSSSSPARGRRRAARSAARGKSEKMSIPGAVRST